MKTIKYFLILAVASFAFTSCAIEDCPEIMVVILLLR